MKFFSLSCQSDIRQRTYIRLLYPQQENSVSRRDIPTKVTPASPRKPPDPRSQRSILIAHSSVPRREKKRRSKRRGSKRPRVFRRADYGWLINCMQPRQPQPSLKLTDNIPPLIDPSKARALTETEAPRPVFRLGPRFNPAEYNPQRRDLPRETDVLPGPKYDCPPGAFGRRGGGGGTVARSASVSRPDRFPRRRLFPEEEIREREDTPAPGTYTVALGYHFDKKVCLGARMRSLGTLAFPGITNARSISDWPLAGTVGGGDGCEGCHDDDHQRFRRCGVTPGSRGGPSGSGGSGESSPAGDPSYGCPYHDEFSGIIGHSHTPCPSGDCGQLPPKRSTLAPSPRRGRCSRLAPAAAAAAAAAIERK